MDSMNEKKIIEDLIGKASRIASTEDLLLYVATTDGILEISKRLSSGDNVTVSLFEEVCNDKRVSSVSLKAQLSEIVRSLTPDDKDIYRAYETLGIDSTASNREVKKAYRKLSKQFHPDYSKAEDAAERFLEIQKAYERIKHGTFAESNRQETHWVKSKENNRSCRSVIRKKYLAGIIVLLIVLFVMSFWIAEKNRVRAMQDRITFLETEHQEHKIESDSKDVPSQLDFEALPDQGDEIKEKEESIIKSDLNGNGIDIYKLEVVIPPDPELLASLEKPFEFRAAHHEGSALSGDNESERRVLEIDQEKKNEMEEKIRRLEAKIKDLEKAGKSAPIPVEESATSNAINDQKLAKEPAAKKDEVAISDDILVSGESEMEEVTNTSPPSENYLTTLEVNKFLKDYARTYTTRNVAEHLAHFSKGALENDKLISTLESNYNKLFSQTSGIELEIRNMNWKRFEGRIIVNALFDAKYRYKIGYSKDYSGALEFHLKEDGMDGLKATRLDYYINE